MYRDNIFEGDSYYALFAQVTYKWLMSREWVTYADIMVDHLGIDSASKSNIKLSAPDNHYGELKKAFRDLRKMISDKLGSECLEEERLGQSKRFRYIGKDDDPLADMRNAKVISDLKQYWQFCQDSAGFFPFSWLEYFFKDSRDLLNIKNKRKKGEQVISASLDRELTNIDLLPYLYEAIVHKQVLSIRYKPYDEEEHTLTFHPHYLKEFNGRWHLFGHADDQEPENGYNIAVDRICSKPRELYSVVYKAAPQTFYEEFFRDIVGVSHMRNEEGAPYSVQTIRIRAHNHYMYKLTETKKIHSSQEVFIPFGQHEDGNYGEFIVNVEPNNEFFGRILQMGAGLEIVAPKHIRDVFRRKVEELNTLYLSE